GARAAGRKPVRRTDSQRSTGGQRWEASAADEASAWIARQPPPRRITETRRLRFEMTDSIKAWVPLAQASVGSAINDTVLILTGARGGGARSILSSRYSSDMAAADQGLLAPAAHTARGRLGAALHLAGEPGSTSSAGAAENAFVGGMTSAIW